MIMKIKNKYNLKFTAMVRLTLFQVFNSCSWSVTTILEITDYQNGDTAESSIGSFKDRRGRRGKGPVKEHV